MKDKQIKLQIEQIEEKQHRLEIQKKFLKSLIGEETEDERYDPNNK